MTALLSASVISAAQAHARAEYPRESCGLVVGDEYIRCTNIADDPTREAKISGAEQIAARQRGPLVAVLHSHPDGPFFPSHADMLAQIYSAVPWGIIVTDGLRASSPIMWGDDLPIAPMIGREFIHGVADCYTLVRDAYRLGAEGMAAQGMQWPLAPVTLPEVPRDDAWWTQGQRLYEDHFEKFGFRRISMSEARPGDAFLLKIKSDAYNHAGVLLGNNLILHHLPTRLSRREPVGIWAHAADLWLRYEGSAHA